MLFAYTDIIVLAAQNFVHLRMKISEDSQKSRDDEKWRKCRRNAEEMQRKCRKNAGKVQRKCRNCVVFL
jgi:hypothetical protein